MLPFELCAILIETIRNEHRNVVEPRVPRRGTEKYPLVLPRNLDERINPCSTTDKSLFVEDEERVLDFLVLLDVVPRVNRKNAGNCCILSLPYAELRKLALPVERVPLLRRCDDIDVFWRFVLDVVGRGDNRLTCANATPEDSSVVELVNGISLMRVEFILDSSFLPMTTP